MRGGQRCDRCDGDHATDACPHFQRARDQHPDAQPLEAALRPSSEERPLRCRAKRVRQPGDGSCLFHSLCAAVVLTYHATLRGGIKTASSLRSVLLQWLVAYAATTVYAGGVILHYIQQELAQPLSAAAYRARMKPSTAYGGAIEIIAFVFTQHYAVWVWVAAGAGVYRRISVFKCPAGLECLGRWADATARARTRARPPLASATLLASAQPQADTSCPWSPVVR